MISNYIVVSKHKKQILLKDNRGNVYFAIRLPIKKRELVSLKTKNNTKSIKSRRKMTHK